MNSLTHSHPPEPGTSAFPKMAPTMLSTIPVHHTYVNKHCYPPTVLRRYDSALGITRYLGPLPWQYTTVFSRRSQPPHASWASTNSSSEILPSSPCPCSFDSDMLVRENCPTST